MEMLVSGEWLEGVLDSPDLVVLDASLHLPSAEREPRTEFEAAHIPGARFLDLATLHDPGSSMPGKIPDAERLAERLAQLGVGPESRVVLYDNSGLRSACRAWFLLDLFGLENVAVLDGGFATWRGEGRSVESGPAEPARCGPPSLAPRRDRLRDKQAMLADCDARAEQVLDARDAGRFTGETVDTVHNLPGGHIPGACNLPYTQLFEADGRFKPPAELRRLFEEAGIDLDRPLVASCGSGMTASVLLFGLRLAGVGHGALYDGSWAEWGADPDTPKETGATR